MAWHRGAGSGCRRSVVSKRRLTVEALAQLGVVAALDAHAELALLVVPAPVAMVTGDE
jgi:hypothetical protein